MAGIGNWEEGQRFISSATSSEVAEWLTEIGYEDFYGKREQLFILKRNKFWYNTLYLSIVKMPSSLMLLSIL